MLVFNYFCLNLIRFFMWRKLFPCRKCFLRGENVSTADKTSFLPGENYFHGENVSTADKTFFFYVEKKFPPQKKVFFTWRTCFHRGENVFTWRKFSTADRTFLREENLKVI